MPTAAASWLDAISRDGFAILKNVFSADQVAAIVQDLALALQQSAGREAAVLGPAGGVYGARNLLTLWPPAATVWRQPPLPEALAAVLGPDYGLVRALFFDKPPAQSWALPWHKDLTIAVRDNRRPSRHFGKPTLKAGVPHVEAPAEVLEAMLTARIHLDDMTEENGPLQVLPGSHRTGKALHFDSAIPRSILAQAGDVLLMRPLLAHGSVNAHPATRLHRRIVHLEFAARPDLPDGYAWHRFLPGTS
jgi:ectoine hydroxylase-related dioxygenase (phytanoyl-CoA dioxygenase family)